MNILNFIILVAFHLSINAAHRCSKTIEGIPCQFPFENSEYEEFHKCVNFGKHSYCETWLEQIGNHDVVETSGYCEQNCGNEGIETLETISSKHLMHQKSRIRNDNYY